MSASLTEISGIGPAAAATLQKNGYKSVDDIANTSLEELCEVPGFGPVRAKSAITAAIAIIAIEAVSQKPPAKQGKTTKPKPKPKKKTKTKRSKKAKDKKSKSKEKPKKKDKKSDKKKSSKKGGKKKKGKKK